MNEKQNILILFAGPHLAFSPTTIQLYDSLSEKNNVTIVAQDANNYNGQELNDRHVLYHKYYSVKGRKFYHILFKIIQLFSKEARYLKKLKFNYRDYFFKFLFIKKTIKSKKYNRIICIDLVNLFFCSLMGQKVDFVSLELCQDEHLLPMIDKSLINCVIIQSVERFEYLFKDTICKVFYVQNAPNYIKLNLKENRKGLIYSGSATNEMGVYSCLDYLNKYQDETLVIQGAFYAADKLKVETNYAEVLKNKRLIIEKTYIDNNDVVKYISDYEIGFCFYNFDTPLIKANYFNYFTAPSGKMFKYLAAGVPVVCINILGFKFVEKFQCGILIDDLSEETIRKAILIIRKNYDFYVENTIEAAKYYSFDHSIAPYLKFIDG